MKLQELLDTLHNHTPLNLQMDMITFILPKLNLLDNTLILSRDKKGYTIHLLPVETLNNLLDLDEISKNNKGSKNVSK